MDSKASWSVWLQVLLAAAVFWAEIEGMPVAAGEWGEWGDWSACTRTCNSGVTVQERACLNGGLCDGVDKQYKSCCVQPCPPDTPTFHEELCATYNKDGLRFKPLQEEFANECQHLRCVEESDSTRQILLANLKDGMPCQTQEGGRGVCLGRMCASVGCDGILGSQKAEDQCLRCMASNQAESSTCMRYSGRFTANSPQNGYVKVQVIPSGATSVIITHKVKPGESSVALKASTEDYFFSGSLKYQAGNDMGPHFSESLVARGPLNHNVVVEVYAMGTIPEVSYTYHLLKLDPPPANSSTSPEVTNLTRQHKHNIDPEEEETGEDSAWGYGDFSACSVTCGIGVRTSSPQCTDVRYSRKIPDAYCEDLQRPLPIQQHCHTVACPPTWVAEQWFPCSRSCGSGQQERLVTCKQVAANGSASDVPDHLCSSEGKPEEIRACNELPCDPHWNSGEWGECSALCGPGTQQRRVVCVDGPDNLEVSPEYCIHLPLPPSSQTCTTGPCTPPPRDCHWVPALKWHKCSNPCGYGTQDRNIHCRSNDSNHRVNASCCEGLPLPPTEQACLGIRRCTTKWAVTKWRECMGMCECGVQGARKRNVKCVAEVEDEEVVVADVNCDNITRPESMELCDPCPQWVAGTWGPCSVSCGPGLHHRHVTCQQNGRSANGCELICQQPSMVKVCTNNTPCEDTTPTPTQTTPTPEAMCVDLQFSNLDCGLIAQVGLCSRSNNYYRKVCCDTCKDIPTA